MEKLIVKNFGPIKEAEIDLTKYVIFIGDTSTGKSVLAKLIATFKNTFFQKLFSNKAKFDELIKEYNIEFTKVDTFIEYQNLEFVLSYDKNNVTYFDKLKNKYINTESVNKKNTQDFMNSFSILLKSLAESDLLLDEIEGSIQTSEIIEKVNLKGALYIPAERIIYSMISESLGGLSANNVALAKCYKDFAAKYELARKNINEANYNQFGFNYSFFNNVEKIEYLNQKFNLNQSSSGIQSLIPLLLVFDNELTNEISREKLNIIIEEPELSLFPNKQKLLIEYFVKKVKDINCNIVITTHSPYILSVLDTLILANNTYNEHPDLKEEISAIISEDKWIDYNDISVYEVLNDGTVKSIKNEEFKSIDTNVIDRVSDIISEEFDKLTALRYAQ